jgi:hypothetical protein
VDGQVTIAACGRQWEGGGVYGFDKRKAWRAGLRYAVRFTLPLGVGMAVWALSQKPAPGGGHDSPEAVAVFEFAFFSLLPLVALAWGWVDSARSRHLYGKAVTVTLDRRLPVATWFLGIARVRMGGKEVAGKQTLWCFGMPWQLRRLKAGQDVQVVQDTRPGQGGKWVWLPFWEPAEAAEAEVKELGREIMSILAEVLRPLEEELEGVERKVAVQGRLAGCGGFIIAITIVVTYGLRGAGVLIVFAGFGAAYFAVQTAYGGRRRRAVRAAVERFDERFPEGTPEREAALMMLGEEKSPTPAWKALRKALIR